MVLKPNLSIQGGMTWRLGSGSGRLWAVTGHILLTIPVCCAESWHFHLLLLSTGAASSCLLVFLRNWFLTLVCHPSLPTGKSWDSKLVWQKWWCCADKIPAEAVSWCKFLHKTRNSEAFPSKWKYSVGCSPSTALWPGELHSIITVRFSSCPSHHPSKPCPGVGEPQPTRNCHLGILFPFTSCFSWVLLKNKLEDNGNFFCIKNSSQNKEWHNSYCAAQEVAKKWNTCHYSSTSSQRYLPDFCIKYPWSWCRPC